MGYSKIRHRVDLASTGVEELPYQSGEPPCSKRGEANPSSPDDHESSAADELALREFGPPTTVLHDTTRDQGTNQEHAKRNQEQIVHVTKYRNQVGDEVNRTQGVGDHACGYYLDVLRYPWVSTSQIQGARLTLESPRSPLPRQLESHDTAFGRAHAASPKTGSSVQ
jgi:hypothetical protein